MQCCESVSMMTLFVLVPPLIITSIIHVAGLNGSAVLLPCSARGIPHPTIAWFNAGTGVRLTDSPRHQVLSNGTLHITDLLLSDGGLYQCEANNEGGLHAANVTVDVHCKNLTLLAVTCCHLL